MLTPGEATISADVLYPRSPPGRRSPPPRLDLAAELLVVAGDEISVKRILAELGLSPPEEGKPPPIRDVIRMPVDDEGRELEARLKTASFDLDARAATGVVSRST